MKAYEWDIVAYSEQRPLKPIDTNEVAFMGPRGERIIINVDKPTGALAIYKTGYLHDDIEIYPKGSNKILIK